MTVAIDRMKESVKVFYHTYVWTVGCLQTLVNKISVAVLYSHQVPLDRCARKLDTIIGNAASRQ